MIEIYRKDLNISGVVYQTDINEVAYGQWGQTEQHQYFINNKLARHIYEAYFIIEEEKTTVYKLLNELQQVNQNDEKEQFLIIKIQDEKTSLFYFGVFLEHNFKEQFKKQLPFSTFLIEQFNEQIKNWNEKKDSFINFENLGDKFVVQYLEPTFVLQKKITPLEINITLERQEVTQNEQIENLFRKIYQLNLNKDKIQDTQSQLEDRLQQFFSTETKLIEAQSKILKLEDKIQKLEQQFSSELQNQNQSLLQQVGQLNETKKSWDNHLSEVFQQNQQLVIKLSQQGSQQKSNKTQPNKLKPVLQKYDDNVYQSNQFQLEENKPIEFNIVLKDIDQDFKLAFTDFEPGQSYYDVLGEDFTYKFEYPSGILKKGETETSYAHPFGIEDQLRFVLLDDGNRKTLQYSINGIEKPAIKLHGVLTQFYVVVKFDNDNIPIENYIEFTE